MMVRGFAYSQHLEDGTFDRYLLLVSQPTLQTVGDLIPLGLPSGALIAAQSRQDREALFWCKHSNNSKGRP
jgi:hypothetical protein